MYDSWASRICLFIKGKKHGKMMLDSIDNGPLVYPTVEENGQNRPMKYFKLTKVHQLQDDYDVQATNIILHGLPPDVYALVNHQEAAKEIRIEMTMQQVQVNTKFLNAIPSERSKFITDVKLAKSLYTTNYDQLYAYLSQHERHANEVRITREIYPDPLAFVANSPALYNPSQSPQHSGSLMYPPPQVIVQQVQGRQTQSYAGTGNRGIATTSKGNYAAGQPRVVKCYNCQGEGHMTRQCTQPKWPRNAAWFKEKLMLAKAQENSAFQTEDLDSYDLDCDYLSSAKAVLMENLSSCDPKVLYEVPYSNSYLNDMINQDVQEMQYSEQTHVDDFQDNEIHSDSNIIPYSQYLQESQDAVIQDTNPSAPNDLLVLSLVEQMTDHVAHLDKENQTNKMVNESLTAELERYKERITIFEQRLNVDLNKREKLIDSQMDDLIRDRNAKLAAFQQEIDTLKETLSNNVKEKESLSKTLTVFKTESKEKESKYIDKEIVLEKQNKELKNIISLGYQNPFHLKKAQRIQPTLYDGSVIAKEHVVISVIDDEETLILEEESRSKMLDKQNDPIFIEKKIKISPIDYSKLNMIKEYFGKHFVTQKELSAEQAFWLKHSSFFETPVKSHTLVRVEGPSELPKITGCGKVKCELIAVEFFEGRKPLSPLQLAVEEVMSE
ncbi:copia protein [Tanacetum coccineum]